MYKKNIEYTIGSKELLLIVEPLWEKLNDYHCEKSINFKDFFKNINFKIRSKRLLTLREEDIFVILAKDTLNGENIGYSFSTINAEKEGEIESIYVNSEYRGHNVGEKFMYESLKWLESNNAEKITLAVAAGNEQAFGFYEKFGFYPKVTKLEKIK